MKLAEIINIIQGLIDKINARTGKSDATLLVKHSQELQD